ncbi:hypothetical protein TH63_04075 [Rufibacter radiotolerans]|uniref:Uncharacterized protein n=1 Tax=Rufibacter radiotolerans TaxID=1379910 RepID=A0A0H4VM69_9BACT|nr:hypothetical protein [Rufibacter radiotolerans]AKQ44992.1 hypothetical protein TH63_04075 [Rufibacter radiotolerans]
MTQREVTDQDNLTWTCVQAYAGLEDKAAEKATELTETEEGTVTVVCTPSGGAQTVRLQLPSNWLEKTSDEELIQQISQARE